MKYTVVGVLNADTYQEVEADTPEEAIDNYDLYITLCHHCAKAVEVGDVHSFIVLDEEGNEVYKEGDLFKP